jgi:hypothetical protein
MKILFLFFVLVLTGCATTSSLPQTGGIPLNRTEDTQNYTNTRIYEYPYPRVFKAAMVVLKAWNFTIVKANAKNYAILSTGQMQPFSSGAVLGLYFSKVSPEKTLIETIEKRKIATQTATEWHSSIILDGIEDQLELEDKVKGVHKN